MKSNKPVKQSNLKNNGIFKNKNLNKLHNGSTFRFMTLRRS